MMNSCMCRYFDIKNYFYVCFLTSITPMLSSAPWNDEKECGRNILSVFNDPVYICSDKKKVMQYRFLSAFILKYLLRLLSLMCASYMRSFTNLKLHQPEFAHIEISQRMCSRYNMHFYHHFDGFVYERRNSIVNTLKLRLSCTNPSTSLT